MMEVEVVVLVRSAWTRGIEDTGLNIKPRQQWDYTTDTPRGKARETYYAWWLILFAMFVKRVTVRRKWECVEKNTLCFCLKTTGRLVWFVKWTIFKETIWKLQGNFAYRSCADKKESPW